MIYKNMQRVRQYPSVFKIGLFLTAVIAVLVISILSKSASAVTETSFTIAQIPDTQEEVSHIDYNADQLMAGRYRWLASVKDTKNIKFIAHTGDVVNWGSLDQEQFTRASAATDVLDSMGVPYSNAIGNHDTTAVTWGGNGSGITNGLRDTTQFNQVFPKTRVRNLAGQFETGKVDNIYQTFSAGDKNWMVITHEMWPRAAVVDWMKSVVAANPTYNVIISTHAFLRGDNTLPTSAPYGDTNSQAEWDQFVSQYANIKMVLSAHYAEPADGSYPAYGYMEKTGVNGNKVVLVDTAYTQSYQNHTRLLTIDTANNSVQSSVYISNSLNGYATGDVHDGTSDLSSTGMNWVASDGSTVTPTAATQTVPSAPYYINLDQREISPNPGNASATVMFKAPSYSGGSPVTSYTVTASPGGMTATGTSSPLTVTGLTNGTSYTFTVTATNALGTSLVSKPSLAVTPSTSPVPVTIGLMPETGFENDTNGWTYFGLTGTTVTRSSAPVHAGSWGMNVTSPSATTGQIVGMQMASSSYTKAMSNSAQGLVYTAKCYVNPTNSSQNVLIRFIEKRPDGTTAQTSTPTTVSNLAVNTWTAISANATALENGNRIIPQVYSTTLTSATGSMNYDDCSVSAGVQAAGAATAPSAPTGLTGTPSGGRVDLAWTAPSNNGGAALTDYKVYYKATAGSTWSVFADGTSTATTAGVTGLTNGTSYDFKVTAVNSVGESVASSTISKTPTASPTELLSDPGFESGNGGWMPFSIGDMTRYYLPVHGGGWAMNVQSPQATPTLVGMTQNSVVSNSVAGKTYTASCYVRPSNSGQNVKIRFMEYAQNFTNGFTFTITTTSNLPTNSWTLVQATAVANSSGDRMVPQIYSTTQTSATGTMVYDDCSVTSN